MALPAVSPFTQNPSLSLQEPIWGMQSTNQGERRPILPLLSVPAPVSLKEDLILREALGGRQRSKLDMSSKALPAHSDS